MATPSMKHAATPRELADACVYRLADLDTSVATALGPLGAMRLADLESERARL